MIDLTPLTPGEKEVLSLLQEGKKSREVAKRLEIGEWTVEVHRRHIARKLGYNRVRDLLQGKPREA